MFEGLSEKLIFLGPKLQGPAFDSAGFFKELVVYLEANVASLKNELSSLVEVYQASHSTAKVNPKKDPRPKVGQLLKLQELSQLPSSSPSLPTSSLPLPSTTCSLPSSSPSPCLQGIPIDRAGISGARQKDDWVNALHSEASSSKTNPEGDVRTLSISPQVKECPEYTWIGIASSFWSGNSDNDPIPRDIHPISLLYNKVTTSKADADMYHIFASVAIRRVGDAFAERMGWERLTTTRRKIFINSLVNKVHEYSRSHNPKIIEFVLLDLYQKGPRWIKWAELLGGEGALFYRAAGLSITMVERGPNDQISKAVEHLRSLGIVKFANRYNDAANTILDSIALPFNDEWTSQKRKALLDPVSEPRCHLPTKRAKADRSRKSSRVEVERTEHEVIDRNSVGGIMVATVSMDQLTTPHQSYSQGLAPPDQSMVPGPVSFGGPHDPYGSTDFPASPRTSVDPSSVGVDIFGEILEPAEGVPYSNPYSFVDCPANTSTFSGPQQSVDPSPVNPYSFAGSPADSGTSSGAQSAADSSFIGLKRQSSQPVTNHRYLCHIVNT